MSAARSTATARNYVKRFWSMSETVLAASDECSGAGSVECYPKPECPKPRQSRSLRIVLHRRPIGRRCGGCGRLNGGDHAQLIIELEERSVEQGPAHRSEAPAEAERRMGDPGPASAAAPTARPRSVFLAIDSKLRGCDLVRLQVNDVCVGGQVRDRTTVIQKKTDRPVQFEITEQTRALIRDWLPSVATRRGQYLFPSRLQAQPHLSTRQYARIDAADEGGSDL